MLLIQYVQFMFAQNMNEFMNYNSMNAFRHNTGSNIVLETIINVCMIC